MKIIHIQEYSGDYVEEIARWRWIADAADPRLSWSFISTTDTPRINRIQKPYIARYVAAMRAVWQARRADLIVTHGERSALSVAICKRLLGCHTTHLAWAYTMPDYDDYGPLFRILLRLALRNVDRFISFTNVEAQHYPQLLKLPQDRFRMVPWSVGKPTVPEDAKPLIEGEYIAAMGGEGRDYATLFAAMRRLPDEKLVVVASPKSIAGLEIPDNVELLSNIPYAEALNIARYSSFMVLPLRSATVPCGHGSIISQFYLERATIVTDSVAMEGYVQSGENALTYPVRDVDTLVERIQLLLEDTALRHRIAEAGAAFANSQCTESFTVDYFHEYLTELGFPKREAGNSETRVAATHQ